MTICGRIWTWLAWLLPAVVAMLLLTGCGERSDLKYPDLPATHPLNYKSAW
ncbi:MAG TPA: hypothetical protein VHX44_07515 [Planctomycetota bacterium]|jgi:hypothetical protein|nr:hypothetical protein [Planctomycetota bacterium]